MSAFLLSSLDSNTFQETAAISHNAPQLQPRQFVQHPNTLSRVCLCAEVRLLDVSVFLTDEVAHEVVIKLPAALADRPP